MLLDNSTTNVWQGAIYASEYQQARTCPKQTTNTLKWDFEFVQSCTKNDNRVAWLWPYLKLDYALVKILFPVGQRFPMVKTSGYVPRYIKVWTHFRWQFIGFTDFTTCSTMSFTSLNLIHVNYDNSQVFGSWLFGVTSTWYLGWLAHLVSRFAFNTKVIVDVSSNPPVSNVKSL